MFERYTDRARRVVVLAQEQARDLKHNYIGTEHLLLGLLAEAEGVAALTLTGLDVTLTDVRSDVIAIIGEGENPPSGHIPFTPRCKRVLELGLREALHLGCNYIGTEHLLLGLVREGNGVAAQVLTSRRGMELQTIRESTLSRLDGYAEAKQRDAERAGRVACVCGHIAVHHSAVAVWRSCNWRGCGCPQFVVTEAVSA